MGKKGTKRKTKWRALPLGEEAGGSGNEEDLHDEDQSTTSSIVGAQLAGNGLRRQPFYCKMPDKSYRQTRRFTYDRFRSREPLVKLESKTFDEEEYTKITTPRQDVLFKKGYFGRKRESSVEETSPPAGEVDGEEPLMDQIIITNGFVDERGHYLVNGNSYEIYDPYSNTVTVVVGPPPYANGVTHPVLAAVSCQPVPLQPVDWYPPGADWPSQGSAWVPSYPRNPPSDSLNSPECAPNFPSPDAQPPNPFEHPTFLVPTYLYSESPLYNGVPVQANPPAEAICKEANQPGLEETGRKSTESVADEDAEPKQGGEEDVTKEETTGTAVVAEEHTEIVDLPPAPAPPQNQNASSRPSTPERTHFPPIEAPPKVLKLSHSTQTNLVEDASTALTSRPSAKESHSTQTPSEDALRTSAADAEAPPKINRSPSDIPLPPPAKPEGGTKPAWKAHGNRCNNLSKKFGEESPKKSYHQRTNLAEKAGCGAVKVSYAKKAMSGLEGGRAKMANGAAGKVVNGGLKGSRQNAGFVANGMQGEGGGNGGARGAGGAKEVGGCEERRNGLVKGTGCSRGRPTKERSWTKYKGRRTIGADGKCEETRSSSRSQSRSQSEKSWTVSELSSPTELSSGQNTPPEKLIVQKMEQEIKKTFEVKLKQNLTKKDAEEEVEREVEEEVEREAEEEVEREAEEEVEREAEEEAEEEAEREVEQAKVSEKSPEKPKGKRKKHKGKSVAEKQRETPKGGKRKKKRAEGEAKEKTEADTCGEDMAFLSSIRQKELFDGWDVLRDSGQDLMSGMGSFLNGDEEILKSLGIDGRMAYTKLPLHSDLLMILPTIGWSRPKLRIEELFASTPFDSDLFTKRNITNMKSTKPEEFFASVVDGPVVEKTEKKKESGRKGSKPEETPSGGKKPGAKAEGKAGKAGKAAVERGRGADEGAAREAEGRDGRLGIVEAVNTWLQEQGDSEKVLSIEGLGALGTEEEVPEMTSEQKNGGSNPIHASSAEEGGGGAAEVQESGGCIRVANVINDGFVHMREEFPERVDGGRMYRSCSWDAKLSDMKMRKHFKFLTDSASFCQDLISDVRNGLPAGDEYATEELCHPKKIVRKYYTLAPKGTLPPRSESDSENEVFDALEYKFLPKETHDATPNGNASITDSGVHSDVELSEDAPTDHLKEKTCKLQ